ncbi:unnamed protein product, partial [Phaeothamnion confervicola]
GAGAYSNIGNAGFAAGAFAGAFGGDNFGASSSLLEGGAASMFNPMMAMGAMNNMGGGGAMNALQALAPLLGMLEQQMGGQGGFGGQQCGFDPCQMGGPQGFGPQGGFDPCGNVNGAQGVNGANGVQGDGIHQLQKGQSYTSPTGTTYDWTGDTLKVTEPGQQNGQGGANGANGNGSFAASMAGTTPNGGKFAASVSYQGPGGDNGNAAAGQDNSQPREWNVYGDPHTTNPDGSKSDWSRTSAVYGTQGSATDPNGNVVSGDKIVATASGSNKPLTAIDIVSPGGNVQNAMQQMGIDPSQTTNYGNGESGKFTDAGSMDQ